MKNITTQSSDFYPEINNAFSSRINLSHQYLLPDPSPWLDVSPIGLSIKGSVNKVFASSLVDTVRVLVNVQTPVLETLMANPNVRRNGAKYSVLSRFKGVSANIFRRQEGDQLTIEASIPKFLTGQNLVGIEDLDRGCQDLIGEVLERTGIEPTRAERRRIAAGDYQLKRVDFTVHCDCLTEERAHAAMQGLRVLLVGHGDKCGHYGNQSVYLGQSSSRRTLRVYRKDLELVAHPMSASVYHRERLMQRARALVRIELVLRAPELKRLGLQNPHAWSPARARALMQPWLDDLCHASGVVPQIGGMDQLPGSTQIKLRAHLLGDTTVFALSPTTYSVNRRAVLAATGIDIANPVTWEQQRDAVTTVRQILGEGIRFKDYGQRWAQLKAGATSHADGES